MADSQLFLLLPTWRRESRAFSFNSICMFCNWSISLQSKPSLKIQALLPIHLEAGGSSCLALGTITLHSWGWESVAASFPPTFMRKNSFSCSAWRILHSLLLPWEERSIWNGIKKNMHMHFGCFLFQLLLSFPMSSSNPFSPIWVYCHCSGV